MTNNDFFLGDDDAKTLGNIDYMRTVKRVRKTFAQMRYGNSAPTPEANDGYSAMQKVNGTADKAKEAKTDSASFSTPSTPSASSSTTSSNSFNAPEQRRRRDSSMDAFRNMARSIGKGR